MQLSESLYTAMGFRKFNADEAIVASFESVTTYSLQGIAIPEDHIAQQRGEVAGVSYAMAIGVGVNAICESLVGEALVEDEAGWKRRTGAEGPLILVHVGPGTKHTCTSGYVKLEKDGHLTTYDCFPGARRELVHMEGVVLPQVVAALACAFAVSNPHSSLRPVSRESWGRTSNGTVLQDMRVTSMGTATTLTPMASGSVETVLVEVADRAPGINREAADFMTLGLAESDDLKRFLYLFLAIEIEVHAVFKGADRPARISRALDGFDRSRQLVDLVSRGAHSGADLLTRFLWCATFAWTDVSEVDIDQFKTAKKVRDEIAHGDLARPPGGSAGIVEQLARKILWCRRS